MSTATPTTDPYLFEGSRSAAHQGEAVDTAAGHLGFCRIVRPTTSTRP